MPVSFMPRRRAHTPEGGTVDKLSAHFFGGILVGGRPQNCVVYLLDSTSSQATWCRSPGAIPALTIVMLPVERKSAIWLAEWGPKALPKWSIVSALMGSPLCHLASLRSYCQLTINL